MNGEIHRYLAIVAEEINERAWHLALGAAGQSCGDYLLSLTADSRAHSAIPEAAIFRDGARGQERGKLARSIQL